MIYLTFCFILFSREVISLITFELKEPKKTKLLIALNGHTIRSFSKEIKVSSSFLTQVLNTDRKASAKTAKKISEGLGKEIEDIFFVSNA